MQFKAKREEIPWYPSVDFEQCTGCQNCYEFCSHGVYEWNQAENRPIVAHPYECIVGCTGCYPQCPSEAIHFPPLSILKPYRG